MVSKYGSWRMGCGQPIWVGGGWGKRLWFVWAGRKNGFVWYFPISRGDGGRRGLEGRELHAGFIVAWGNGVAGGRAFVFNGKWGNVGVNGRESPQFRGVSPSPASSAIRKSWRSREATRGFSHAPRGSTAS